MADTFYVSITGLRVRTLWLMPRFWVHAVRTLRQIRDAEGCISADVRLIQGVHHTLSVWQSKDHMRAAIHTGAHLRAIRDFRAIATGKTFGYETDAVPHWDDVHQMWQDRGRDYG